MTRSDAPSDRAPGGVGTAHRGALAVAQRPRVHPFPGRLPAPPLRGAGPWLNVDRPLDLADLRGRFVVLDFWTFCCINCMHILPELKQLEAAYPNEVVVIGVHSAKFHAERDSGNIRAAIARYEIEHPVVNDADLAIWTRYGVTVWPSLRIIDPEGYLVAGHEGEVRFADLDRFFKAHLPYYRRLGQVDSGPLPFGRPAAPEVETPLRFPGQVVADEAARRLYIADSNHNRVVVADLAGTVLATIGSGQLGSDDGDYRVCSFRHPQGMALRAEFLYVADTGNHLLRKVDLAAQRVTTIAGAGPAGPGTRPGLAGVLGTSRARAAPGAAARVRRGAARRTPLRSPWALWANATDLYIAMAGAHQIWRMPLDESSIGPYAGNGHEDIVDGPLLPRAAYQTGYASFAQPSGLTSDGKQLYVADSEGSSIRAVPLDARGQVTTLIGTAHLPSNRLFTYGDVDGQGPAVRLQHVLGVVYGQGRLYLADTYNHKIKVVDLEQRTCRTLAGTGAAGRSDEPAAFNEPAGLTLAAGKLYVADTNNHLIRVIELEHRARVSTLTLAGLTPPATKTSRRPTGDPRVAAGT
ncbi:MAG: hypothetical protein A2W31_17390 [Planctomycetes bacterium RBG_16_64_10]|nr:MAG: hypothetical protein A2W31_17390 [Planctomycetes bacterium RBG_16_64_10]